MKCSVESLAQILLVAALAPIDAWTPTTPTHPAWRLKNLSTSPTTVHSSRGGGADIIVATTSSLSLSNSANRNPTESFEGGNDETLLWKDRRQFLQHAVTTTMAAVVVLRSRSAHATTEEDGDDDRKSKSPDPLEQFGESLSQKEEEEATGSRPRWPETSVSPILPPETPSSAPPQPSPADSDFSKALNGMQKKRQIDPRTHG